MLVVSGDNISTVKLAEGWRDEGCQRKPFKRENFCVHISEGTCLFFLGKTNLIL